MNVDDCGVALVGQKIIKITSGQHYEICVSYIDNSRDKVMQVIHDLAKQFPVYEENINVDNTGEVLMKAVLNDSIEFNRQIDDDGKIKNFGELSLIIVI